MQPLVDVELTGSSCHANRLRCARATAVPAAVDARERVVDGDDTAAT
jgi:hypothetical protein